MSLDAAVARRRQDEWLGADGRTMVSEATNSAGPRIVDASKMARMIGGPFRLERVPQ